MATNSTMLKRMKRLREWRYLWQKVYRERLLLQIFSYLLWQFVEVLYQLLQLKREWQLVHNVAAFDTLTTNKHSITFSAVPGAFCCSGPGELWTLSTPNVRVTWLPSTSTIFPTPSFTQPCSQLYGYLLSLPQATKSLTMGLVARLKHIHTHFQYPYQVRRTRGELSRCTHFGGWLQGERETQLEERANPSEWVTLQQREENKMAGSFTPRLSRDSLGMLVGR